MPSLREQAWFNVSTGEVRQLGRMLGIYGLLGIVAGLFAIGFEALLRFTTAHVLYAVVPPDTAPFTWPQGLAWLVLVLPAAGGLVAGLLCARLAPEAMGPGMGQVIDAYLRNRGEMRRRVPTIKTLASAITLGTGGSGGVEGPIAQVSAGIGAWIGRLFRLDAAERRVLLMAGCAAGVGAVFHAPMAAAILAAEVLYRQLDIEHEVLVPAIIAATIAHGTYGAVYGWTPLFAVPAMDFGHVFELVPYLVLAVAVALGGVLFVTIFRRAKRHLGKNPRYPLWLRPALGGLGVGLVGLLAPQALGPGYAIVDIALAPGTGAGVLLLLAVAKMATSALTTGAGGSAGIFAPSLVIGGAIGGAVGRLADAAWPALDLEPAAFVVVGMAGFFAAVSNAPLSTVIMVSELAGNYRLIVPALWVCALAWLLTRRSSIFDEQVATRLDAPFRLSDMMGAVLSRVQVRDAMDDRHPVTVPPDLPLRELVKRFAHSAQAAFPILDPQTHRLLGVVDGQQLRRTLAQAGVDTLLIANDFQAPALTCREDDTLFEATSRMAASGFDEVIVVAADDPTKLVGVLSRRQVVSAYHRRMLERAPDEAEPTEQPADDDLAGAVERGGILPDLTAATPDAAVAEMLRRAVLPEGTDRDHLLELLRAREALGSTGVGDGIALPHPHAEDLGVIQRPHVIVGLLTTPIDWQAYDGRPVETVCILLSPSGPTHLALLGALARALHDPALRKLLRQRAPAKDILARIKEIST